MVPSIRLLYVDDEPSLLEIGKLFLEDNGEFAVDTVTSAREALSRLKTERYDAIIADYQMPEMDGIQFLVEVRTHFGPVPFILFTGRGREEIVIQALNSGADFYIQKGGEPVSQFAELSHKVISAVTGRSAETALRKSEEKFRYLVENALEAIMILDFQGTVLFANNAVRKLIEAGDFAGLIGRNVMDFIAPESREDVIKDFILVSQGHDAFLAYYHVILANGKKICTECIGKLVTYEGKPADLISIRDITESKQHEEVVRQKNLMLTTLNDLQREFAELPAGKRVEDLVVTKLRQLSGAEVTLFSVYDSSGRTLQVTSLDIEPGMLEKAVRLLGKRPEAMKVPVSEKIYQEIISSVIGRRDTLTEISFGQIPPLVSTSIQKLLGIDHFVGISYVIEGELYGTSILAMKPGQPDPSLELLESFAHIVAVSLRRRK